MALEVKRTERDLIRVFAISRTPAAMTGAIKRSGKAQLATELLGHPIPENGFELFPVADLAGIGLTQYLADGYTVAPDQLGQARQKLEALDGYVMLVFSSAFDGQAIALIPDPDLTLIGTFGEAQADHSIQPLESDAALMQPSDTTTAPAPRKSPAGSLMVLGMIVLAGLVLYLALR